MESISSYAQTILAERDWSWTLIAILYLIIALFLRSWLLKPLLYRARQLDHRHYHQLKRSYLSKSLAGWICLAVSTVLIVLMWKRNVAFPPEGKQIWYILGVIATFVLSVLMHITALASATLEVLKDAEERQKVL